MKIVYIANHRCGGNDDEGAIAHALHSLGHEVIPVSEHSAKLHSPHKFDNSGCDFILFHKWCDPETLKNVKTPKVFWYFDLVTYPDTTLAKRNQQRINWMNEVTPLVDLGFCTDGDWVEQDTTRKLVQLSQGCDLRVVGRGEEYKPCTGTIMFCGGRNGGVGRNSFVDFMKETYGSAFNHVQGSYSRTLADEIACSNIVVAPDHPVTDRYWSNRVYMTLGFGAFLLHPYCEELAGHYEDFNDLVFYKDRGELKRMIDRFLHWDTERRRISENGMRHTRLWHSYTSRCVQLIATVKERLGI